MSTENLGYSYMLPTGGLFMRIRNSLSQFSDLFSEFNKYIAPAFHHDRCERSVHMRLYAMNKREFVLVFLGFFACFGLGIFIGLAGPPITLTKEVDASSLRKNDSTKNDFFLATGPFVLKSPFTTTYSQQMWLFGKIDTESADNEVFDKSFQVNVEIKGLTEEHKPITVLSRFANLNRTRHLKCIKSNCEEFTILHLGWLEYSHYIVKVHFYGLTAFHKRYNISKLTFYFKTYNPAFSQIEIWFRFIFLFFTFIVTCWFAHVLRKYPIYDWSSEQRWISLLLPLLLLYDNPLFPLIFLSNSYFAGMIDAIFQATFLCALLCFWLCIYHGLRQNERKFITFYLPKLLVILPIWISSIILATWTKVNELNDPTYSHFVDSGNYNGFKVFFYISGAIYLIYLVLLILRAYSELRSMPFFDKRLKFLTLLMLFVIFISLIVTMSRFGFGILEDNFVASLNTTYKSSAHFMCFYGLLNFYIFTCAYVYSPSQKQIHEPSITKDNPTFSMLSNSDEDEEIVYGSEDDTRMPLNSTGKATEYDSD